MRSLCGLIFFHRYSLQILHYFFDKSSIRVQVSSFRVARPWPIWNFARSKKGSYFLPFNFTNTAELSFSNLVFICPFLLHLCERRVITIITRGGKASYSLITKSTITKKIIIKALEQMENIKNHGNISFKFREFQLAIIVQQSIKSLLFNDQFVLHLKHNIKITHTLTTCRIFSAFLIISLSLESRGQKQSVLLPFCL